METMLVHCMGCRQPLRVPARSSGRRARCPSCKTVFVVPKPDELVEETVSTWIEQDLHVIDRWDEQGVKLPEAAMSQSGVYLAALDPRCPTPPPPDVPEPRKLAEEDPQTRSQPGTIIRKHSKRQYWGVMRPSGAPTQRREPLPRDKPLPLEQTHRRTGEREVRSDDASPPGTPTPPSVDDPALAKVGPTAMTYPTNLQRDPVAPHLVVTRSSLAGITFAFDAIWLTHEAFRGSMPVRCAFCGISKRDQLIARPLVFYDRGRADKNTIEQDAASLEHRHIGDRTARQLATQFGEVPHMPPPFHLPMPWFVSTRYAHLGLHCVTRNRSDGGITCEVLIPDPHTALAWLVNVNGMCGPEYELLEREVSLLHGEAWRALSDACRERISYWCKLEPGEQFRLFISDSDFGKRDDGLGGIVITDQRLVFCKYHHRGQVRLDDEARIRVKKLGDGFATLTLVTQADRQRMAKIAEQAVPSLLEAIDLAPGLRYEIVHSADETAHGTIVAP